MPDSSNVNGKASQHGLEFDRTVVPLPSVSNVRFEKHEPRRRKAKAPPGEGQRSACQPASGVSLVLPRELWDIVREVQHARLEHDPRQDEPSGRSERPRASAPPM